MKVAGKYTGDWMRVPLDNELPIQDYELFYGYNSEDHFVSSNIYNLKNTPKAKFGYEYPLNFAFLQIHVLNVIVVIHYCNGIMVMNPLFLHYFILLHNAFSITVHPVRSYAVEKIDSMLEAADVLKSSGKELLSLVPRNS